MLVQRIITAVVLLAVLLAALLAPAAWPLVGLLIVAAACALWEWLRLTWPGRAGPWPTVCAVVLAAVLVALAMQWRGAVALSGASGPFPAPASWLLVLVAAAWVLVATTMVVRGRVSTRTHGAGLSLFGVAAVLAAWLSLSYMFLTRGAWFLVSLLALIWLADIAAYFTGKAFGRHKLAPRVSPGKTWEGALGGVVAGTLWVLVSSYWTGSFGAVLLRQWPWWAVIVIAMLLTALSIVGDLFESLLKRRAGVKDSSRLLPGHGGVYDRIDALLPIAPIALLLTGVWP